MTPAVCVVLATSLWPTVAGAACKDVPHTIDEIQSAVLAGSRLVAELERTDARVAIVGRIGSDQSKRGIRYTHAGLSLRDHPRGRWHFIHLLNDCGSSASRLFEDGAVNFFLEHPLAYDAWVVIPTPTVQEALIELVDAGVDGAIHEPKYNAIAHPFRTRSQNSNQWLLELIALALDDHGPRTRAYAQATLRRMHYEPSKVKLGLIGRIGARRMKNVSLREHRRKLLGSGKYPYVSVRSTVHFLERSRVVQDSFEIDHESGRKRAMTAAESTGRFAPSP